MNKEALTEAINKLQIRAVRIRSVTAELGDDIEGDPSALQISMDIEGRRRVIGIAQYTLDGSSNDRPLNVHCFHYEVGLRGFRSTNDEKLDVDSGERQGEKPSLFIQAVFELEYEHHEDVSEEAIREFARDNVGFHAWPYWRELVDSMSKRMSMPMSAQVVPMYSIGGSRTGTEAVNTDSSK